MPARAQDRQDQDGADESGHDPCREQNDRGGDPADAPQHGGGKAAGTHKSGSGEIG
jgi:hypothetical protein